MSAKEQSKNLRWKIAGALVALTVSVIAPAQVSSWTPPDGYTNQWTASERKVFKDFHNNVVDERIDPLGGKLGLVHTDAVMPGPNGMDIRVVRSYRSPSPRSVFDRLTGYNVAIAGIGWAVGPDFPVIRGMIPDCPAEGWYGSVTQLPTLVRLTGESEPFYFVGANLWMTRSGYKYDCRQNNGTSTMHGPDGRVYSYEGPWGARLKKVEDRYGNWVALEYGDAVYTAILAIDAEEDLFAWGGPLSRITSSDGRRIDFTYDVPTPIQGSNPAWNLTKINKMSFGDGVSKYEVNYEFDSYAPGSIAPFVGHHGSTKFLLKRVLLPDGSSWQYQYHPVGGTLCNVFPGSMSLSRMTYPTGGTTDYTYTGSGQISGYSGRVDVYSCNGSTYAATQQTQVATKVTSDGGSWRYRVSEGNWSHYDATVFPGIPNAEVPIQRSNYGNGDGPNFDIFRVDSPDKIVIEWFYPRYGGAIFANINTTYYYRPNAVALSGFPIERRVYETTLAGALGALVETTKYAYGISATPSVIQLYSYDTALTDAYANNGTPNRASAPIAYLSKKTVTRGTATYVTRQDVATADCPIPASMEEEGQRKRHVSRILRRDLGTPGFPFCAIQNDSLYEAVVGNAVFSATPFSTTSRVLDSGSGKVSSSTSADLTEYFSYDAIGELQTHTDARGFITRMSNYKRGLAQNELHPVTNSNPTGDPTAISISRTVDLHGRASSETDGEGNQTQYGYDGLHRVTSVTPAKASSSPVSLSYSATTVPSTQVVARGSSTQTVTLDGFGRVASVNDNGTVTNFQYDGAGRKTFQTYPGKSVGTRMKFDAFGRIKIVEQPNLVAAQPDVSRTFAYDDSAARIDVTNERGYTTKYYYEAYGSPDEGWLRRIEPPANVAGATAIDPIDIVRNGLGQITSVTQGGVVTRSYAYNASKGFFLDSETHPELGLVQYTRDNAGNMTGKNVNSSGNVAYGYDGKNRLTSVTYPPNSGPVAANVAQTWHRNDLLKSATTAVAGREYFYDQNKNLTSESLMVDGIGRSATYAYDALDHLSSLTYPSNRIATYAPDARGRASAALPFVSTVNYFDSGLLSSMQYANNVYTSYGENARSWTSALSVKPTSTSATKLIALGFSYDAMGNVTTIDDTSTSGPLGFQRSLQYDTMDQLLAAQGGGAGSEQTFEYDAMGNISKRRISGAVAIYAHDAASRKLLGVSGAFSRAFGYDAHGNVASNGTHQFGYDFADNLRIVGTGIGTANVAAYDYDAHQQRVKEINANGQTTHTFTNKGGQLLGEYTTTSGSGTGKEHVYLTGKRVGTWTF